MRNSPSESRPATSLPRQWRGVNSIGVVGSRGTGKTCFLGAAYGAKTESTHRGGEWVSTLGSQDETTSNALRKIWAFLKQGRVPPANAVALPTELSLRLAWETPLGKRRWTFSTIDYSGEFIQLGASSATSLKADVRKWLAGCDAVLFFVGLGDPNLEERLDELDVFITELQKQSGRKDRLTMPVGLVLTKWDVEGTIGGDVGEEEERANRFVQTNPQFRKIAATVKSCGDWFRVFPVSAFGMSRDDGAGMAPPTAGAEPFNVLGPLVWAAEQASNLKSARFVRRVKAYSGVAATFLLALGALFAWDTTLYGRATGVLDDDRASPEAVQSACDAYADVPSPFKYILGRKSAVASGRAHFNDRTTVAMAHERCVREPNMANEQEFVTLAKSFVTAWPNSRYEVVVRDQIADVYPKLVQRSFDIYIAFRKDNPSGDKAALRAEKGRELIERFLDAPQSEQLRLVVAQDEAQDRQFKDSAALVARLRVANADADKLGNAEQKYERLSRELKSIGTDSGYTDDAKEEIKTFRTAMHDAEEARDRYWADQARTAVARDPSNPELVLKEWGDYGKKGGVLFRDEAKTELARVPALQLQKDWNDALRAASRLQFKPSDSKAVIAVLTSYTQKHPKSTNQTEAERLIAKARSNYQELLWTQTQATISESPGAYDNHIKALREVALDGDAGDYADKARIAIAVVEKTWDAIEYAKFRSAADSARSTPTAATIQNADDAAARYLRISDCPRGKNADTAAKNFREWVEGLKKEQNVTIKVVKASVPFGSQISDPGNKPDCFISVTLNGSTHRTTTIDEDYDPVYNENLGPFKCRPWGKQTLKVKITDVDPFGGDDEAEAESLPDEFILGKANGVFEIICKKGKTIKVHLECEQALVPAVPAYND